MDGGKARSPIPNCAWSTGRRDQAGCSHAVALQVPGPGKVHSMLTSQKGALSSP